jgi:hypothetical protein
MVVERSGANAPIAEMTSHSGLSFFWDLWFSRNRFQTRKLAGVQKAQKLNEKHKNVSLGA